MSLVQVQSPRMTIVPSRCSPKAAFITSSRTGPLPSTLSAGPATLEERTNPIASASFTAVAAIGGNKSPLACVTFTTNAGMARPPSDLKKNSTTRTKPSLTLCPYGDCDASDLARLARRNHQPITTREAVSRFRLCGSAIPYSRIARLIADGASFASNSQILRDRLPPICVTRQR